MNERFQEYPKLKELIRLKVTDLYFIKIIMSLFYLYHSVVRAHYSTLELCYIYAV